jgi:thioredoxin reductase (NADPH)
MSQKIKYITSGDFENIVIKSEIPVIIDFYAYECPPCEILKPIYEKMAEKYGERIKFIRILGQANKAFAKSINVTSSPTVLFYKSGREVGQRLTGFINKSQIRKAIEEILGDYTTQRTSKRIDCDVIIIGAGVAGLSSAIYASRSKMITVVTDEGILGGKTGSTYHVANYPGTPGVIKGKELTENMRNQAISFGTIIEDLKEIFEVELIGNIKHIRTEDTDFYSKAVIIASGAQPKLLKAEGADYFKGRGVHYCATCDGALYQNKNIIVVGGDSSAIEEAIFLTKFAHHVTIINQSNKFKATRAALFEAQSNQKINLITNTVVKKINGSDNLLTSVLLENIKTGELTEFPTEGAFVYIGAEPLTHMFSGQVRTNKAGYIVASEDTKTNLPGVFAAGDIRTKLVRQVVTAAADGAVAGIMAERYVHSLQNFYQQDLIFSFENSFLKEAVE